MQISVKHTGRAGSKKLIVFDLDGTLTETKSPLTDDVARLLMRLIEKKPVAIIGGGRYAQFKAQFLKPFHAPREILRRVYLFPTTATSFYRYKRGWRPVYVHELSKSDRVAIKKAFREVLREIRYVPPPKVYGAVIEDRRTQISFSALGQDIVAELGSRGVRMKKEWKRKHTDTKLKIAKLMARRLPHLEVHAAGFTTIDVTRHGIDKAYGIRQIEKNLKIPRKSMLFVGDAIFPGGNDYAVVKTGIDYVKVRGPADTKIIIRNILSRTG